MDVVHKQEFKIRDLGTRSVTLFPARASVAREIRDVKLKPGVNEITITGITPTADEDSVKVEGTGSAVISDLTVELLPNREIFDEIYPESDEDSDEDYDEDNDLEDEEDADIKAIDDAIKALDDDRKAATETVSSGEARLKILDHHGTSIELKDPAQIRESVAVYEEERKKTFEAISAGQKMVREIEEKRNRAWEKRGRLLKRRAIEKRKAESEKRKKQRADAKAKDLDNRRKEEARGEKARIRREHQKFWPRSCYSVRITLDATSLTPSTSRRSSIASAADIIDVVPDKAAARQPDDDGGLTCDLVLTYITSSAFWAPAYDVQLSTTTDKAALCFDAKITNTTSESWNNCKVILSTSQTTFAGLDDKIPSLTAWRIKLGPKIHTRGVSSSTGGGGGGSSVNILRSVEEQKQQSSYRNQVIQGKGAQKPRAELFGASEAQKMAKRMAAARSYAPQQMMQMNVPQGGGLFGASSAVPPPPAAAAAAHHMGAFSSGGGANARRHALAARENYGAGGTVDQAFDLSADSAAVMQAEMYEETLHGDDEEEVPELEFQESAMEETGLTTTYDIPGTKSLVPRSAPFKQRVARINLSNVYFSHTVVAKYKPVAYLKARLKNTSRITLLKGRAGLTLDGTFLGQTELPRCSVGDTFTLSLGVDPAVKVAYPKPDVRRSTAGVFSKEESSAFTRVVTVTNTRSAGGKPINVVVLDQVPVSEDERLRVELLFPKGLAGAERGVNTGTGDKDWGRATAVLKKNGEVSWDAVVNPGKAAKLGLEYVVALPSGEQAVQV